MSDKCELDEKGDILFCNSHNRPIAECKFKSDGEDLILMIDSLVEATRAFAACEDRTMTVREHKRLKEALSLAKDIPAAAKRLRGEIEAKAKDEVLLANSRFESFKNYMRLRLQEAENMVQSFRQGIDVFDDPTSGKGMG